MMGIIQALFSRDSQLLPLLLSVAAIGVAYLTLRKTHPMHTARERMTKVVSPLFELLEPVMCQESVGRPIGTLRAVLSIIQRGAYLAGGRLWVYRDKQDLLPESIDARNISLLVSFEYDSLCQVLGIPLRTISYRKKTYKAYFFLREMGHKLKEGARDALCILCMAFVLMQMIVRILWIAIDQDTISVLTNNDMAAAATLSIIAALFLWLLLSKAYRRSSPE